MTALSAAARVLYVSSEKSYKSQGKQSATSMKINGHVMSRASLLPFYDGSANSALNAHNSKNFDR